MKNHGKKAAAAVIFGIISFVYYLLTGMIILVLIAFRAPIEAQIYTLIIPVTLSSAGFSMAVYASIKGDKKLVPILGIVFNSLTLCIAIVICILIILTKTVYA